MDVQFFESLSDLHHWFETHHDQAKELQIGFYKKASKKVGVTYQEALDEALAFGWIDGVRNSIDGDSYTNRFTPRKPRSIWSAVNIKRVGELIELGRMQPSGLKVFEARDQAKTNQYSYEREAAQLDAAETTRFQENAPAWNFFQKQTPSYQRVAIWWVISVKKPETRLKRLTTLIEDSARGQKIDAALPYRKPL